MNIRTRQAMDDKILTIVLLGIDIEGADYIMRCYFHIDLNKGFFHLVKELPTIFVYETKENPEYGNNIYYLFKESGTVIKKGIFDSMLESIPSDVNDIPFYKECKKRIPKGYCFFKGEDEMADYFDRVPSRYLKDERDTRIKVRKDNKIIKMVKDVTIEEMVEDMVAMCN